MVSGLQARFVQVRINGLSVMAKIDFGAEVSGVPPNFPRVPSWLQPSPAVLMAAGSQCVRFKGPFDADVDSVHTVLLGLPAI